MEIDLILENQIEVIVGEVKTSLSTDDVKEFLEDLATFTEFFPIYRGYRIYGTVAALNITNEVASFAYRRGLFVLRVMGDGMVTIRNDEKFTPRDFGQAIDIQIKIFPAPPELVEGVRGKSLS